eukprot:CAMPEP_0183313108 /NCGR_PEP_ID=MMETSP0160_2-20130417/44133_1 /TAXON_ID=2839 ORGANISM="Odontella Sinensis, Strain Grunow 1884" /NCGR_SAMPLE_ID=MMETSP0160_2 /ASSEMBLY_ACC=CAM_ASM_000250 /LENGTH=137 /DNA_ID=CAMNT_0025478113 /DNA_START=40 /DNA_END=450 /DNA_ORIENTATION=-
MTRILFIGNSFTTRNDLPGLLASLVSSSSAAEVEGERELQFEVISAGGASLRRHPNKGDAQTKIRNGSFDCVVLQEQSTLPIKNGKRATENMTEFDAVVRESDARTVPYMTGARGDAPRSQDDPNAGCTARAGRELG